ncbi:MAG: rRNA maturation RNase YbeY [Bacteroidia bacterium]
MPYQVGVFMEGVDWYASLETMLNRILPEIAREEGRNINFVNIILLSDEGLQNYNLKYLQHSEYTDVITFDLSTSSTELEGEIYISADRVRENARAFEETQEVEMIRVIIHGLLHLIGYKDKSEEERKLMRQKEDFYLDKHGFTWNSGNER